MQLSTPKNPKSISLIYYYQEARSPHTLQSHTLRNVTEGVPRVQMNVGRGLSVLPQDKRGHVVACMNTHSHWHAMHACILHHPHLAPTCTCDYLRSHTPFSCVLPPPVTFLLSNTRASLKLTSPESSDSSPRREQEWEVGRNWWVTGVPDSRLV